MEHFVDKWHRMVNHAQSILDRKGVEQTYGVVNKNRGVPVVEFEDHKISLSRMPGTSELEMINLESGRTLLAVDKNGHYLRYHKSFTDFEEHFFGL